MTENIWKQYVDKCNERWANDLAYRVRTELFNSDDVAKSKEPVPSIKNFIDGCCILAFKGGDKCAVLDTDCEGNPDHWTLYHVAPGVIDRLIKEGKTLGEIEQATGDGGCTVYTNSDALYWVRYGKVRH